MSNENPAPATPATSPAVAQRFAEMNDLVKMNVYGKELVVPLSEALKDIQLTAASKQAMEEAKRIRGEAHIDREHAERWRTLEHQLKTNPEQALAGLERLAGVTRAAQGSDSEIGTPPAVVPDRKTSELETRLRQLETAHNQNELKGRIKEALDSYPVTRDNPAMRSMAEKQLLAVQILDPTSDPKDTMKEIHTELLAGYSTTATQQRDQRAELAKTMPNIPATAGMPDLSDIPQGTEAAFKDGGMKANILRAMQRFGAGAAGNVS